MFCKVFIIKGAYNYIYSHLVGFWFCFTNVLTINHYIVFGYAFSSPLEFYPFKFPKSCCRACVTPSFRGLVC